MRFPLEELILHMLASGRFILPMPRQPYARRMVFSRQPVHIIGDPVHDLKLAGFPFYGKCLVCFGWLLLHGRIDLIISEDVAARAPDAEIAVPG